MTPDRSRSRTPVPRRYTLGSQHRRAQLQSRVALSSIQVTAKRSASARIGRAGFGGERIVASTQLVLGLPTMEGTMAGEVLASPVTAEVLLTVW